MSAIDEQLQPELLKIVNDVFEFDLPLGHMTVDHNSEVSFHYMILAMYSIKESTFFPLYSSTKPSRSVFEISILMESL